MKNSYRQFCPIAKASEVFACRWTPLMMRDLMYGSRTFNDLHRGIPLISRAVLVARLRQLEQDGIIARRGSEYRMTPAGEAFRPVVAALGQWGLVYGRDRVTRDDLDPALLMWGFRKRANVSELPKQRVVVRFEFSGVPASRTKYRNMWLLLQPSGADVCVKDPGYEVDLIFKGKIADFVDVFLGHVLWRTAAGTSLVIEGDRQLAKQLPAWLKLDKVVGRDFPMLPPAA